MQLTAIFRSGSCPEGYMIRKLFRVMRFTAFLLVVACLHVAARTNGQTVTLSVKDAPMKMVFREIQKQTGLSIMIKESLLENAGKVTLDVKDMPVQEVIALCLKNQSLNYSMEDGGIVIKPSQTPTSDNPDLFALSPPIDIHGRVVNAQGVPLVGANVIIQRTKEGTQTNVKGEFNIKKVRSDDILIISYIGYKTLSMNVDGGKEFPVVLEITKNKLDEVIVQAYGTTTQRLMTGDIGRVTAEEIERQPVMNPLLALQGRIAGLVVSQINGYASAPVAVELRGRNTIAGFPSDPLYIIDGVPLTVLPIASPNGTPIGATGPQTSVGFTQNGFSGPAKGQSPLFSLNPWDIESIEVLKDADATSIYGSRGGNGVILITTKKGKVGATKVDLTVQQGISEVTQNWQMLNTQQYLEVRQQAFRNDGIIPTAGTAPDLLVWDTKKYADWQKELWGGTGKATNLQLGISGGNANTTFRIGGSFSNTTNIQTVSGGDQKGSASFSIVNKSSNQKFSVSFSGMYSIAKSDMINLTGRATLAPNAPSIYDSVGNLNFAGWAPIRYAYPFAGLKIPYSSTTNFLTSNLVLNYQIIKGLNLSTSFGYNNAQTEQQQFTPIAAQDPNTFPTGQATFGTNNNKNWIIEPQLNYSGFIGSGKITILAGGTYLENTTEGLYLNGTGYSNDNLLKTIANAPHVYTNDLYGEYKYLSFFTRINYNWQNKYILNLNARRDGSSRFGENNLFGNFGSVGAAWIFTEESFMKSALPFLSTGKIRGSYGTTGSDQVGDYRYLSRWSSNSSPTYAGIEPLIPSQHANPDFQWQVNTKLEIGMDLGFLQDAITVSGNYYRDRTGNQLLDLPLSTLTGFPTVTANSPAEVQNEGWEFTVNGKIINHKDFSWSLNFNIGINRNKLLAFPNLALSPYANSIFIGQPLNIVQLLHYTGVDPLTGLYTYKDKNHDGVINADYNSPANDLFVYNLNPKYTGGFGSNFGYKGLQLNLFFSFVNQIGLNAYNSTMTGLLNQNISTSELNYWKKPGDISEFAKPTTQPTVSYGNFSSSDGQYTDASFIRLSNVSLSYKLPQNILKKINIQGWSFFINAQNLFVITKYKGLDPETQNFGSMPPVKTIVGGLTLNL